MSKADDAVVKYLEKYGQPQTYQAIVENLAATGHEYTKEELEALVKDKRIKSYEEGVNERGEPITQYAPKG